MVNGGERSKQPMKYKIQLRCLNYDMKTSEIGQ